MSEPDGVIDVSRPTDSGIVLSSTAVAHVGQYVHVSPPVPCESAPAAPRAFRPGRGDEVGTKVEELSSD